MLLSEMIKKCQELEILYGDLEITILDGFNGGGVPRTINSPPRVFDTSEPCNYFCEDDNDILGDINTKSGKIIIMGYGSY